MSYYVYLYLRKNDLTPYYVGKGKGRRAWQQHKNKNDGILTPEDKERVIIVAHKLGEQESFLLEKKLIKKYGRKDIGTGILRNLTDGGEGPSGRKDSDKTKQLKSTVVTEYHKTLTEEEKKQRGENCGKGQRERYATSPDSEKTRKRKSDSHKGEYRIVAPDGREWFTKLGLKDFAEYHGEEIGRTYWQLFQAYRTTYSNKVVVRRRKDNNLWKVWRLDA